MKLTSSAFHADQVIPKKFTGEDADVSPALSWTGAPAGTKSFALICDDPDAPRAEPWVHWVAYNIPATVNSLPEDVPKTGRPAELQGGEQGMTDFKRVG